MNIQYTRNFSVGTSTHIVKLYNDYTAEQGLADLVHDVESTRMDNIFKAIKSHATEEQLRILRVCMKDKIDVIVLTDGSIGR
jgi:predicted double-glycine peptidase